MNIARELLRILILAALWTCSACITTPTNGDVACGADAPLDFGGFLQQNSDPAWLTAVIEVGPTRSGPFKDIARARASFPAGSSWGMWTTGAIVVPRELWGLENGVRELYVRARHDLSSPNPFYFFTYDNPSLGTGKTTTCVNDRVNEGMDLTNAMILCRSPDSPIVRVTAPLRSTCGCSSAPTVQGDVVIRTLDDYDAHRCDAKVTGRFEVTSQAPADLTFFQLGSVGSVVLDYTPPSGSSVPRIIQLPALTSVVGDVALRGRGAYGAMPRIDVGMPVLSTVGGKLSALFMGGNVRLEGMGGVVKLLADVTLDFDGQFEGAEFLRSLESIDGDLRIGNSVGMQGVLPALDSVKGSFLIRYRGVSMRSEHIGLGKLRSVGKDLMLESTPWPSFDGAEPAFGKLSKVGGTLQLAATQLSGVDMGGSVPLEVLNLTLISNPRLSALPAAADLPLARSGTLTALDNPLLSECDVQAFVDEQVDAGFAGDTIIAGNLECF